MDEASSSSSAVASLRLVRLPTSPLKPSVLRQQQQNSVPSGAIGNITTLLATSKPVQVLTASADSTGEEPESENVRRSSSGSAAQGKGGKKKGGKKKGPKKEASKKASSSSSSSSKSKPLVVATTQSGVPFVKHHHSVKKPQTPSVSRRNARERNRVKQVNTSFTVLRDHIPHLKNKTSKVDTLRAAVEYIQALRQLVGEDITDMFDGPVLITDADDSMGGGLDESTLSNSGAAAAGDNSSLNSSGRPVSALSGDINPLVYQLPGSQQQQQMFQQAGSDDGRGSSASPHSRPPSTASDAVVSTSAASAVAAAASSLPTSSAVLMEEFQPPPQQQQHPSVEEWWARAVPTTSAASAL